MIVRAKLCYSVDCLVLLDHHLSLLQAFQLKGLRQILKLTNTTTFVDRDHTNTYVFKQANAAKKRTGTAPFLSIHDYLKRKQAQHLGNLICSDPTDPPGLSLSVPTPLLPPSTPLAV